MNKTSATIVRTLLLGTSCLSAFGLGAAQGQPTGGSVVYGSASITNKNANNTVIDQKTGKAIINWNSFSIGAGGTVTFNQPGSSSIALNRVLGGGVSSIDGKLNANGQVWIINQNGIMFGAGARINVGGLIATTSDIANGDFAAGNYDFSGSSGAAVVNQGTIRTAKGGAAVLSGASVSNRGLIQADAGTVVLGGASAFTVDFVGDGLIKYAITAPAGKADNGQAGVSNSGTLAAAGGRVIMTARAAASVQDAVVNNTGMISATSAKLVNGEVVLDGGDGDVNAGGTIDASGAQRGQTGGTVAITGRNVTVADNTRIDASGDAGGGTVKIGGDLHGAGPLADAANVTVGHAAIRADATRTGKGGTLVVWSNGITDFSGIFSAKGGALGGDGGFAETSGHTLNIAPEAKVDTTAPRGRTGTWLLDPDYIVITAGEGSGTQLDGSGTLALGADPGATDYISPTTIVNALATTNVTLEAAQDIEVDSPVLYASGNALSLMAQGNIYAFASIQNSQATGGGAINLVAGWDGVTAPGAILSTPGAYGNAGPDSDRGEILIDSENADALIGSASGTTTVAGFEAVLFADDGGNAQIGYHGAGGGDINVVTTGDAAVVGQSPGGDPAHYAMIGNGALDGAVTGQVTGNIFVSIGGEFDLETLPSGYSCDCQDGAVMPAPGTGATAAAPLAGVAGRTVGIGNAGAPSGVPPTGSVVFLAGSVDDSDDENGGFGNSILADLAYGDVTVGQTGTATPVQLSGEQLIDTAHNFTLLAAGDIELDGAIENAGSGAITVVAGWDGIYDPKRIGVAGTYGNNDGTITIGGANAQGDSALGTASGALSLYGANLNVTAVNGYAQVGYHGAGGGAIAVTLTGDLTIQGGADAADAAQLGNGSLLGDITGNVGGNITINAGGQTVFENGDSGLSWLGNAAGSGGIETGDVTLLTVGGFFRADFVTADLGTTAGTGGNVFIGFTDPTVTPLYIGGFDYSSAHDFTFAGAGSMNVTGAVQNAGTGAVTLVTGWDGHTVGSAAQLQAANAYGLGDTFLAVGNADQYQDIAIGSAGGLTTILTHDLTIAPLAGFYAQVGYHGTGGGDIHIVAPGALTLTGGDAAHDYAMIGNGSLNGDVTGAVTGNLDIRVGGQTSLDTAEGLSNAWIGNLSTAAHGGSVVFVSGTFENTQTPSAMFASDLTGGDVTFALTDPASDAGLDIDLVYNSPYTLNLLVGGNVGIEANLQNGGSGAINVVAGWDGTTLDPAHFLDAGVFGNGGASLYIGGTAAAGNASVGSAGGVTTLAGANVILDGANGYAQAGFHGTGSGAVIVDATGAIALSGGSAADYAQIGSGATFGSNAGSGDVGLTANSITGAPNTAVAAANLAATLTGQGGAIGAATLPLTIAANTLALTTTGGSAYLASPGSGLTLAGVSLNGGSFSLAAGGAVGQTGAILAAQLAVSTTSGAIALTNAANAVVGQVQFGGPASIGFANSLNINLGAVSAGGDLLLLSKGNVNFAGSVQSAGGAITAVAGWNGTTTDPSQFGAAGAFGNNAGSITIGGTGARGAIAVGSQSGATSLYAANVNVVGAVGNAQLGFHGTGGGAIKVLASGSVTLTSGSGAATIGNGSPGTDVTGAVTGDIDIRAASAVAFNGTSGQTWIGNRTAGTGGETGNVLVLAAVSGGNQTACALACFAQADIAGGDVTIGITSTADTVLQQLVYSSSHTLNVLSGGAITVTGMVQNAGSGAVNVVAGWDARTLTPSSFGTAGVAGNGGKGVTIGGSGVTGNIAIGSAGGTTSIYGASLALNAVNGYAQLGFNGHGTGAIAVNVSGAVTLTGGGAAGQFAQIGNGGFKTAGSNSGAIVITAGGDVTLSGGAGAEAYAQIGHGGAESNTGANGYSNAAPITVTAANVVLGAGAGSAAYAQIGNGGYKVGLNLAGGTATNGGDITVTAAHQVGLTANGPDAYAQIGNGGSQSNANAAAAAGGVDSGTIVVTAPNGSQGAVTLLAGNNADAYAQIGNGGYAANAGATATLANFTIGGNVSVTDLSLTGGNSGGNAYAQIGNGDASQNATANVSGDIVVSANGQIILVNGTGPKSPATIGNFTGLGTVTGTVTGAQPPTNVVTTDPVIIGVVSVNTADNNNNNGNNNVTTINTTVVPAGSEPNGGAAAVVPTATAQPGALASLDNGGDSSTPNTSDSATVVIADSLDGARKSASTTILAGMLKQTVPTAASHTVHGVPPADQDFSSWGNEALWQ